MQVKLVVDSHEVELGWEALESLIGNLPDDELLSGLFGTLAQSKTPAVRQAVVRKSVLSAETVALFASDSSPEVIEDLVASQRGKLTESALTQIISRNWSRVNRDIAQNVESFDQADVMLIAKLLAGSEDPSVRSSLASNGSAPKIVVKELLKDPDAEVRRLARNTLDRR